VLVSALYPDLDTHPSSDVDVLGIGHAIVDVLAGASDEFLAAEGLARGTMHLIDRERADHLYARMGPGSEMSGGCAANTVAGVVACDGTGAFVGTVADDELGEIFSHDIRAADVRYRAVPISGGEGTARCLALISPDGERTMSTYLGAASYVSIEHIDPQWIEGAAITYFEGYLLDNLHSVDSWRKVIEIAHRAGRKTAFTLSDPYCVERHREAFLSYLDGSIDICFGNEEEVCSLFEVTDLDAAIDMLTVRCPIVAVTRGSKGSVLASGDERVVVNAEPVNVVDTTGAGDLYAAGVLAGLAKGWDLGRSGRLGSRTAGAIVSRMGARLAGEPIPLPD
jgi:sugar/nucleoside kinase (ribokinase family)